MFFFCYIDRILKHWREESLADTFIITIIQVLEYKFKLSQEIPIAIDTNLFFQLFRSPTSDDVIKDIVESIYIHFLLKSSEDDARNRYADSQYKNSYCKEVYFSFLASEVALQHEINAGTTNLYEHELCSLVRCTLRHQNFDLADELSTKLLKQSPNNNSELLNFFASVLKLNQEVKGRHLWGLPRPIQKELLQQIDNCLSLIGNSIIIQVLVRLEAKSKRLNKRG